MEHLGKPGFGIEQPAGENWSGVVPSGIFYPLNDLLAMLFCDAWVPFFQNHDHHKSWYAQPLIGGSPFCIALYFRNAAIKSLLIYGTVLFFPASFRLSLSLLFIVISLCSLPRLNQRFFSVLMRQNDKQPPDKMNCTPLVRQV